MEKKTVTYDTRDGSIGSPIESQPVIVIRKGKRKINPLFEEMVKNVPQEVKDRVEKVMACKWLRNGNECGKGLPGTPCDPDGCVAWEHYKEDEK